MNQYHVLAAIAGILLPLQIAFNNRLTSFSGNPLLASLISFSVGTVVLLVYSISNFTMLQRSVQYVAQAPWYAWLGGVVGAFYVVSTVVASPKIGIAMFLALVIGGQLIMSMLIDHFGWLGMPEKQINLWRLAGLILIVAGVMLIKK